MLRADGNGRRIRERFGFQIHFFPMFIIIGEIEFLLEFVKGEEQEFADEGQVGGIAGGTRFWAMALYSLPRAKLMSVAVMKRPVRVAASSEPRRSDSMIWRSARAWKMHRDG
jgi:hypothetical protein